MSTASSESNALFRFTRSNLSCVFFLLSLLLNCIVTMAGSHRIDKTSLHILQKEQEIALIGHDKAELDAIPSADVTF